MVPKKIRPSIGSDFIATARGLLTDDIRRELKNLSGFRFTQHPEITVDGERLDLLSGIVNRQIGITPKYLVSFWSTKLQNRMKSISVLLFVNGSK